MNVFVMGDGKAVRFVAQPLEEVQDIGETGEKHRVLAPGEVDFFIEPPPFGAAIRLLFFGKGDDWWVGGQVHFFEQVDHPVQLAFASIQHQEVEG